MKAKNAALMLFALLLVVVIAMVSLSGVTLGGKQYYKGILNGGLNKGIDLAGGAAITFEATDPNVSEEAMNLVEEVMRTRLRNTGYSEARVSRMQSNPNRIRVEIPNMDAQEARTLLGSTAKLSFTDAYGNEVLTGNDIADAAYEYGQTQGSAASAHHVKLVLTDEGRSKFTEASAKAASLESSGLNYISIFLDNREISRPYVNQTLAEKELVITGDFDRESAGTLANQIKSGQLPVELTAIETNNIGAELGDNAFTTSLWAALIGLIIIMLFMLAIYRLPGLVANIALIGYVGLMCLIIVAFKINLSLAGIAGIILSIGMAVDANVLIFERIKEELRNGKTVRASVDAGFKRALTAILDGNITTLIAAIVLYASGVATVQGFAITLLLGVVLSMFTAITLTRFLLRRMVNLNISNPAAYGAKLRKNAENAQ